MKIKLPVISRSTYERETNELVADIKVLEGVKDVSDKKIEKLKLEVEEIKSSSYFAVREKDREIKKLKLELEKRDKQIQGMEWCIQERDKDLEGVRSLNFKMCKQLSMVREMQRQVRDKIDTAFAIDFVTKKITPRGAKRIVRQEDFKKLSADDGEDLVEVYTKIGMML